MRLSSSCWQWSRLPRPARTRSKSESSPSTRGSQRSEPESRPRSAGRRPSARRWSPRPVRDPRACPARQRHLDRARAARARAGSSPRAPAPPERALPAADRASEALAAAACDRDAPSRGSRRQALPPGGDRHAVAAALVGELHGRARRVRLPAADRRRGQTRSERGRRGEDPRARPARADADDAQAASPGNASRRRARGSGSRAARPAGGLPEWDGRGSGRAAGGSRAADGDRARAARAHR